MNLTEKDFNGKNLTSSEDGYVLFHADWCGYCQKIKPVWEELKKANTHFVGSVNCTDGIPESLKIFDIKGFPSIQIFKNGIHMGEYDGERTFEALQSYANRKLRTKVSPMNIQPSSNSNSKTWLIPIILLLMVLLVGGYFLFQK